MTPPPSLREKLPDLSPEVEQVIFTALAKEPGQRFGSVQAFATALEVASKPQPARPAPTAIEETVIAQPALPLPPPVLTPHQTPVPTNLTTPVSQESAPAIATPLPAPIKPLERPPSGRKISRRTVVAGLVASGVLALGGGIAWVKLSSSPSPYHLYVYRGHSSYVSSVAWSRDGTRVASGSDDHTVQVWNAADGSNVFTYKGHANSVNTVAWSPDGTRIASGSADKTVQVWRPQ